MIEKSRASCAFAAPLFASADPSRAANSWHQRLRIGASATLLALAGVLGMAEASKAWAAHPNVTAAISVDVFSTDPTKFFAANDYLLMANVYESLYGHDEKGNLVPTLATGVEIKDDGLTYEFSLRPNVKFHNGNPYTAEDVRFSWQKAIDPVRKWPAYWLPTVTTSRSSIPSRFASNSKNAMPASWKTLTPTSTCSARSMWKP